MFSYLVSVSWGISDGHIILAALQFPQGGISVDGTLTLSFQFIQDPSQQPPSHVFNGSFVNPNTFIDQMTSNGRLTKTICPMMMMLI